MANDNGLTRAPEPAMYNAGAADDEIDLRQIFSLLKAGRWTIAIVVAVAVFLGAFYAVFTTPIYDVNGLVQVETSSGGGGAANAASMMLGSSLGGLGSMLFGSSSEADTEMQIIQSRLVLDRVIDQLNLLVEAEPDYFPLIGERFAAWNLGGGSPSGAPPLLGAWAWGGETIKVTRFEVPAAKYDSGYTLTAGTGGHYTLYDGDGNKVLEGQVGQQAQGKSEDGPVTIFVQQLVARPGEDFSVTRRSRQKALKELGDNLTVTQAGASGTTDTGIIQLDYQGKNKQQIVKIVDAIENAYLQQNVERHSAEAEQSLKFLNAQLPELKEKVATAQAKLADYQQGHGAANVADNTSLLLKQNVALETQRQQLIQQREQALQLYTPQHPVVKALDRQIASVEDDEQKLQTKIGKLPDTQQKVLTLMRDVDVSTQLYTAMLNAIQQFQVAKAGTVGNVRIVDYALAPLKPSSPKKGLTVILALLLGGFLGVAYVFIQRLLLKGIDDPAEIERQFGLNVLGSIPYTPEQRKLAREMRDTSGQGELHLLAVSHTHNLAVESLRSLRTALHFAMLEASSNIILLTGPAPGIGKSFVAANFGAVLAAAGKRVLVIDGDLRRGHLQRYFGLALQPGLSDAIANGLALDAVVQGTGVDGLDLIARGEIPPNPAELLMHERFERLVAAASSAYDFVLIDAPPVLAVADAAIIGKVVGATLLVFKSAEHPPHEIEETVKRLVAAGIRPRGALMNQVGARAGSYGYGNYGYSYYKYEK